MISIRRKSANMVSANMVSILLTLRDGERKEDPLPNQSGVNGGQREHKGSFRGHPKQGGGAVFS